MTLKGIFLFALMASLRSIGQDINPEKPDLSPTNFHLDSLPLSELNIPILVNLKPLYTMAEKSVDTVYTSPKYPTDWLQEGCDVRYKYYFHRSPLLIKASGIALILGFNGYYKIEGSTRLCIDNTILTPWTPPCRCGYGSEGERRVFISFTNTVSIQPDYKLKLNITRNDPRAFDKCEVCFWKQDITKQVLNGLRTQLDDAKKDLDKKYGTVDLRSSFRQVWDLLCRTYDLYGLGWLRINPQGIHLNKFYATNDSLNIMLGLTAKPSISFEKPADQPMPMPNLGQLSHPPGFSVFLDAVLNYDSLSAIMNKQIAGQEFTFKKLMIKKKFVIDSCRLYGGGNEKMVVKINFSGTNTGIIYLLAKPVYDSARHLLNVTDVEFDIKSKNLLLKTADWLFDRKITKEITRQARFDLTHYVDTAKTILNQQLNRQWMKGISSSGSINTMTILGFYPMQQYLVLRSNCTGSLAVKVDDIDFSL
jgi:hypothetical protein